VELSETFFGGRIGSDVDGSGEALALDESVVRAWVAGDAQARAEKLASILPYTTQVENDGSLEWSNLARMLIDIAPDPLPVLNAFRERFFTGVGSGPFSLRFVRRRPLVATMLTHHDPRIRTWARETGDELERDIVRWDERDRERESRFE
jgi:hypothetical protein